MELTLRTDAAVSIKGIYRGWEVRHPIPSLAVLAAKQVDANLIEEEVMMFAPLSVHLIRNMRTNKRKKDKEMGEKSPTPILAQKKGK